MLHLKWSGVFVLSTRKENWIHYIFVLVYSEANMMTDNLLSKTKHENHYFVLSVKTVAVDNIHEIV